MFEAKHFDLDNVTQEQYEGEITDYMNAGYDYFDGYVMQPEFVPVEEQESILAFVESLAEIAEHPKVQEIDPEAVDAAGDMREMFKAFQFAFMLAGLVAE